MRKNVIALATSVLILSVAFTCRAEWQEIGRIQVAPLKVMVPQLQSLASKIKFPLLPMMVSEAIAQCDFAQKIGAMDDSADWGGRFYIGGTNFVQAWFWPVSGGKTAWAKAHPDAKPDECFFTKDGRYASVSDNDVLAKKSADAGFPFSKPMKKGFARLVLDSEEFFSQLTKKANETIKEIESSSNVKVEIPEWNSKLISCAGNVKCLTALLGMSKSGIDLRMRVTPKDGTDVEAILAAVKAMGATLNPSDNQAKTMFPESAKFKNATIVRISEDAAETAALGVPSGELWIMAWRDGRDVRVTVRVSLQELTKAFQSMMQLQVEEMSK